MITFRILASRDAQILVREHVSSSHADRHAHVSDPIRPGEEVEQLSKRVLSGAAQQERLGERSKVSQ